MPKGETFIGGSEDRRVFPNRRLAELLKDGFLAGSAFLLLSDVIVMLVRYMMKTDNETGNNLDFHSIYKTFHPKIVRYLANMIGCERTGCHERGGFHKESLIKG